MEHRHEFLAEKFLIKTCEVKSSTKTCFLISMKLKTCPNEITQGKGYLVKETFLVQRNYESFSSNCD